MSQQAAALKESRPVESVNDWLARIQAKADATHAKFARVARDLKDAADEEAEHERRMQDRNHDCLVASRDDGDCEGVAA